VRWLGPLLVALASACTIEQLDLSNKRCPCVSGYVCDEARDLCVTSLPDAEVDAAVDARPDVGSDTPPDTSGPPCAVKATDTRMYCTNKVPAKIRATPANAAAIVDELRTSYSWFSCWKVGEKHAGGNTTWYYTLGDSTGKWGYVAAVDLITPAGFNDNPSAHGVVKCP
jgi:hypothetical protein